MVEAVVDERYGDRLQLLVSVANEMGTGVSLSDLLALLPRGVSETELRERLANRPDLVLLDGDVVLPVGRARGTTLDRQVRGSEFGRAAQEFVDGSLAPTHRWVRTIGLTGSTAYGEPREGDDIDFMTVTRTGAVWVFLAYCYLAIRLGHPPKVHVGRPEWCFNYVVDDATALRQFRQPGGFLFAREALSVRVLWGPDYYDRLLGSAGWMASIVPRLFEQKVRSPVDPPGSLYAPWMVRLLNAAIFPLLATYLQLKGLIVNDRCRREGRADRQFATRTEFGGIAFVSARFERLRSRYERVVRLAGDHDGPTGELTVREPRTAAIAR
jgi:hypothetical protein